MKRYLIGLILLFCAFPVRADEGMWMVNAIDRALYAKMQERGLQLAPNEIYNADTPGTGLCDAVLSLDFECTGSFISDNGLVITNHHCAYHDIYAMSNGEHNYLEEGYWAMTASEEVPIPGKSIYSLKKVLDVTDEVNALIGKLTEQNAAVGMHKVRRMIERKYNLETGLETSLYSMWDGSRYYLAVYEVYTDIRLVAAPPVNVAAFGGDIDNWEWPQHKCDFALYRIYTGEDGKPADYSPANVPLKPGRKLSISLKGYREGDFTMVIGYPGLTDRYSSSAKVDFKQNVILPISNELQGKQMSIIKGWMDRDPSIRLKYSNYFFELSNIQELNTGEVQCYRRFDVVARKREKEKELQEWIDADAQREGKWGGLLPSLSDKYKAVAQTERDITWYEESIARCSIFQIICASINTLAREVSGEGIGTSTPICAGAYPAAAERLRECYASTDMRVERELSAAGIKSYYGNVDSTYWGPFQKELHCRFNGDCTAISDWLWSSSIYTDTDKMLSKVNGTCSIDEYRNDPMYRFYEDAGIFYENARASFNEAICDAEEDGTISGMDREYIHALYQMEEEKGIPQYPDANSSMRLTYGTIGPLEPYDGIFCSWRSTPAGILEKEDPQSFDFHLDQKQKDLLTAGDWGNWGNPMYVDFITDNDITGGSSGSPVLNSKGDLIGLAFDGNKESLASESYFADRYGKCVCVDIRFVLWTLDKYAGMKRIIDELELK